MPEHDPLSFITCLGMKLATGTLYPSVKGEASMFKNVLVGLGTALLGCVATLIVGMLWMFVRATMEDNKNGPGPPGLGEQMAVSFSPLGFINHFWWFWWLVLALGVAGFLFSYWRTRTG